MADTLFAVTLMGPTASGKTDLALELVDRHPFEIISVDSAMVYRTMDIGTAKPSPDILTRYPHHLIDICDPAEPYSAAAFRRDAIAAAEDIFERGKIPLLVGGTMLYFKALKEGLADLPSADEAVRAKIQALADSEGWPAVHARLSEVDPEAAARLDQNDSSRLQRALEIYEVSGTPMSELHKQETKPCPFPMVEFAIFPEDRAALHEAIARRFRAMLETGLIEEVRHLYERGDLTADTPSMKAVGYRQVWEFLRGDFSEDELAERGIIATRQLAKRQFTWLRSWRDQTVLPAPDVAPVLKKLGAGSIL